MVAAADARRVSRASISPRSWPSREMYMLVVPGSVAVFLRNGDAEFLHESSIASGGARAVHEALNASAGDGVDLLRRRLR